MAGDLVVDTLIRQLIVLLDDTSLNRDRRSQNIVNQIKSSFSSQHTKSELDVALSVLFQTENSLLDFISRGCCEKTLKGGVKDSLALTIELLEKYTKELARYFVPIKDVCFNIVQRNCGADVQEKAYQVIKYIISSKESVQRDLQIPALVDFLHGRGLTDKSIKSLALQGVYEVYGAIASKYPEHCSENKINSLLRNILHRLHTQMRKTNDVKPCVIEGCMNALKGVLKNFTRGKDDVNPSESKEIYTYVRDACAFKEEAHRRVYQRAALDVFTTHLPQLWGWIVEDQEYKFWLRDLPLWAARHSSDDKYAGIRAMEAFHKQALAHLTNHPDDPMKADFMLYYRSALTNPRAADYDMRLAIEGFSALAGICGGLVNQEDVSYMFRVILQRAQTDSALEERSKTDNSGEQIAKYLESLSNICTKLHSVSSDQLSALTRLWRLVVERYPHHYPRAQANIARSLTHTILTMGLCDASVFDRFLYPVVYQGIIITCSHSLVEEAELQEELTGKEVITYKNYQTLWKGLLRIGYEDKVPGVTLVLRKTIVEKLYDCLIQSLVAILDKLNVGYKRDDSNEVEVKNDPESSLRGEVPQDHSVLCNLANLYRDLLAALDPEKLSKWLAELVTTVVNQSVKFPLVSAFYKLLAAILSVAQQANYFADESEEAQSLGLYVVRYLEDVMLHCKQYKNDLQASSLLAIISAPILLITPLLAGLVPVMQMIFRLGQSLLSLAHHGMDALELWQRKVSPDQLKPILHQVLPLFDPYLRSRGITTELPEDEGMQMSKRQQKRERRIQEASRLSELQKRMLRLLSLLDSASCLGLLRRSADTTAWSAEPTLTLKLPFPDQRFYVHMDPMLPRVVELALASSDRQTKAVACEVLHAFVIVFIGNGSELRIGQEHLVPIVRVLSKLVPPLLKLSCGSDLVARQLFHPLTLQLMHWFSSPMMIEVTNPVQTEAVLLAIWDGITDEEDTALQDFSALCLREFVEWSIKQSSEERLARSPVGIKAVIRQITTYCQHPSLTKRRGAALAFCHVAKLLREETSLVDRFWLELMYHLVCNLELGGLCHDHPATSALAHVLKVVKKNVDLFSKESAIRRVPDALGSGMLQDVLRFLLRKCGSKTAVCAVKCREMLMVIMPLVPDSPRPDQLENMVAVCEGAGNGLRLPNQLTPSDIGHLRASIDCYAWSVKKGFISPSVAIKSSSRLICCVEYFINFLGPKVVPTAYCSRQDSADTRAKCDVVVALFDLLAVLGSQVKDLPYTLFGNNFCKLLAKCIFSPHNVGLDWRNRELSSSLTDKLRLLLCTLRDNLGQAALREMYAALSEQVLYDCTSCVNRLSLLCQGLQHVELKDKQYVMGLITLYKTDLLQHLQYGPTWNGSDLVFGVFSSLFDSEGLPLHPETSVKVFADQVLAFAVQIGAEVRTTLKCVMDSREVNDTHVSAPATTTKGQHFLALFEDRLIAHLLQDPVVSVSRLLNRPSAANIQIILQMLSASKYAKVKFNRSAEALLSSLTADWSALEAWAGPRQAQLVPLVQALVQLLPPAAAVGGLSVAPAHSATSTWLFRQIKNSDVRLEYKADLVELLPSIVSQRTDSKLEEVLEHLQAQFPVSSGELRTGSVERNTFVAVYTALLHTLVATGSITVLRVICESAADKDHACTEAVTAALEDLMRKHNQEVQIQALKMVHDKFLDDSKDVDFRLGIMSRFLIPLLCHAVKPAVTQFYADRVQNIIDVMEERLRLHEPEWRSKQQLVRKVGACQMIESLFNRIDKAELENEAHPVVKAANIPGKQQLHKYLASGLLNVKKMNCSREELQDLFRCFQCAAYNALTTFVCNTNQNIKVCSVFAFKEDPGAPIWRKIVPTEPKYTFPIDFDDYPKIKKQLVQMRSMVQSQREGGGEGPPALYLPSQSLFNSSLQEDITTFDFSLYNVRDADRMQQLLSEEGGARSAARLDLEEDCLNNHECMATLCAVVKHLCEAFPASSAKGQRPQPPLWMEHLRASLTAPDQPDNCRAFIAKLILNCASYFKPFAHFWISPVVQCVLDNCVGDSISYLVHDIVGMLFDWHTVAMPNSTTEEKLKASEFLRKLVLRTTSERIGVLKYNIEVIKCVVAMWKSFLSVPYQELLDLMRPPSTGLTDSASGASVAEPGILLAEIFLSNDILPFNQTGKSVYYEYLLVHLQRPDQKIYKFCARVIGKILSIVSEDRDLEGEDLNFYTRVLEVVKLKDALNNFDRDRNNEHFIFCLHQIQINYRPIVKGFEAQCISLLHYPGSVYPVMLLEILTTALDYDFRNDAFSMLADLPHLLEDNSNPDRQVAALKLIIELVTSLTPEQMSHLLPSVVSQQNHKRSATREVVYDIVSWIYDNYRQLRNENAKDQVKEAKAVLIAGLADPDNNLQAKLYRFWSTGDRLSSQGWGRLIDILQLLYSPSSEPVFLNVATTLLLDLCQQTDEYKRSIFLKPLSDCVFEKYAVSGSYRTQHAAFVPMFADTLASQISSLSLGSFTDFNFQLRATQQPSSLYSATLQPSMSSTNVENQSLYSFPGPSTSNAPFGNKYKQGPSFGSDFLVSKDTSDGETESPQSPMFWKRRLIRDQRKVGRSFAERNQAKAAQQQRQKDQRQRKREGEVKLTRDYRRGDLPDIQIPCSDVLTALTTLAKRDQLVARQLIVIVYKGLAETDVNTDVPGVCSALDHILQTSTTYDPSLVATVLEMGLVKPSACLSSASVITQVSKNSHQMSLGALLVEARLMTGGHHPPSSKRVRGNTRYANYDDWMYLAEIYHSLEEKDVVQGLFEDKIAEACSADVREALQAEDQARWKAARIKYDQCLTAQSGTAAENFLYEASFKCSAHLSQWEKLNETLRTTQLENDMEEVWSDSWNRDHLLPWLFLSEVHRSQETTVLAVAKDFNSALTKWLEDPDRKNHIESKLSQLLSVLLVLRDDTPRAKLVSDTSVKQFLTVWQQLDSLNNHLRGSRLLSVHRLMDIDRFLDLPPTSDVQRSSKVLQLFEEWKSVSPSKADSLISWETQAVYRNIFVKKLEAEADGDGSLRKDLSRFKLDNYEKTLVCALEQKNCYVARKYYYKTKNEMRGKAAGHLDLNSSRVRLLRALLEKDPTTAKVDKILEAWEPLIKLREQEAGGSLAYPLNLHLHSHSADIYSALLSVVQEQPSVLDNLPAPAATKLSHLDLGPGDVTGRLTYKVVASLEQAVAVAENKPSSECGVKADAYLKLTQFCHQIDDPQYRDKLIESLLRAMKYGSAEARILFPCLLEPSLADHTDLFMSESKQVPEWMFLSWVAQLLAHLDTDVGHVVAPLLINLAKTYPTALQFPFHLSKEMYQYKHPATKNTVDELSDLLKMDPTTMNLLRGLSFVCQPHMCLLYHIDRLKSVISQNLGTQAFVEAYVSMRSEAFPPNDNDKIKGKAFSDVKVYTDELEKYYNQVVKNEISISQFLSKLGDLNLKVKGDIKSEDVKALRSRRIELADFSPWLVREYKGEVEIPGQYTGESRPLPNHHITIAAFKRHVRPVESMRMPMQITIVGNDARDHPFLVKFGEDLRQDQRIQQLFVLMNQLLSADVTASRRQLSLQTYSVVPLNSRLGIIQWVENTKTLQDFMISGKDLIAKAAESKNIYHDEHFYRCNSNNPAKFFQTVKKEDSIQMYLRAVNELPPYMLRDAVWKLSTSPEAFVHLRSVMLMNHACLSVCHWLLGIGDRHLNNTLVCMDSGRLLGIDFGHAFGTATQLLAIPELMPMRLTPQILNLAAPLGTTGLIKETMVHTLRVLRENLRLLLATMTVFILEPSVDWLNAARKHKAYREGNVDWYPQQKISLARRKLEGVHPRKVTEEDLRAGHESFPHFKKLLELLSDEGDSPHLRNMPQSGLSPRQQVECLIAQATNRHILSKTYTGWASWV